LTCAAHLAEDLQGLHGRIRALWPQRRQVHLCLRRRLWIEVGGGALTMWCVSRAQRHTQPHTL
jgi:hypothetical protein